MAAELRKRRSVALGNETDAFRHFVRGDRSEKLAIESQPAVLS